MAAVALSLGGYASAIAAYRHLTIARAAVVVNQVPGLPARIAMASTSLWASRVVAVEGNRSNRLSLAARLLKISTRLEGDPAARLAGLANVLGGKYESAVTSYESIQIRAARDWNDLAVAYICAATERPNRSYYLSALSAVDRALALDPTLEAASFNRAAVVDAICIEPLARQHWQRYLHRDRKSAWSKVARQRLGSIQQSDVQAWETATARIAELSVETLAQLTAKYPESARKYADAVYLSSWATALSRGDLVEAEGHLTRVRVIAKALANRGEPLLMEAVSAIDLATGDPERLGELVNGHLAYFEGRIALNDGELITAEKRFRAASVLFAATRTPMAFVTEFWLASVLTEQQRTREAFRVLTSLFDREVAAGARHRALIGHIQYQLSLLEALRGNWSASLAAARRAQSSFALIGERGNLANANAMLSEDYDLLGQPELAWSHGFAALRDQAADGAVDRQRVTLAALCRTEMRGGRWERAHSIATLEAELAPFAKDVRLDPDMLLRAAAIEFHRGNDIAARRSVLAARNSLLNVSDANMRAKLLSDINAAEGSFIRHRNPRRGVSLLTSAINFQLNANRPIIVPELYLQRGRAFLAEHDLQAAERDFEAGLSELERQRTGVREAELRPGIFDDAAELFDEAIALQLRKGASAAAILRQVERGRARALLEQITATDESFAAPVLPRIADLQRALDQKTALVEYVALPDRLVALVITREGAAMKAIAVKRDRLQRAARAFIERRGVDGGELYGILFAPLRAELRNVTAINVVADDFLQRVPFGALFDRSTRTFLLQRYSIATPPSAGVFLATHARSGRLHAEPEKTLVFANPTIPRNEFGNLASLIASEYEAKRIARQYANAEVFAGDEATSERFRQLAPSANSIHFAGHGIINEREPYASALVCAATPGHPGAVTVHDISRMKFRATRVVVLAACSTLTGRNAAVEGVPSLARAFVVAGVPAVVGTLWDIEDTHAAAITRPLHQQLAQGADPADALRFAQLAAIRNGLPPEQWAAFALMGNATALPAPVHPRTQPKLRAK